MKTHGTLKFSALLVCLALFATAGVAGAHAQEAAKGRDKDALAQTIRAQAAAVRHCYADLLGQQPEASGRLLLVLQIEASGKVSGLSIAENDFDAPLFADCVTAAALQWRFAEVPGGGVVEVRWPYVFSPADFQLGSLDREVIRSTFAEHRKHMRLCYERVLHTNPDFSVKLVARFLIDREGVTQEIVIERQNLDGTAVIAVPDFEACIAAAIGQMRFEAPKGNGVVQVSYPLVFSTKE